MRGKVDQNNMSRILSAKENLEKLNLIIDESAGIDVDYVCSMSRRFSRKQKDGVVIIDHLGLLRGNPRLQKVHQIEEITTKLKSLSKTIKAPVLLLSQLSRAVELRDDKKPMLSDLRDSGSIEQDADVVIFAYRPEYYAERKAVERTEKMNDAQYQDKIEKHEKYLESIRGKAFLYVEKNRQGTSGTVELNFDGVRQKFS
jgi:replicative DNA helicase